MRKRFFFFSALLCAAVYLGYLRNGFIFDDRILILNNPLIKSARLLPFVFKTAIFDHWTGIEPFNRMYRPLQMLSYWLDYRLWGIDALYFRIGNIALHFFNSFIIFHIIWRLFRKPRLASYTSLLFLVHPLNAPLVSYISGRADLLSAFFMLAGVFFFVHYLDCEKKYFYLLSLSCAWLALFCRENALTQFIFILLIIFVHGLSLKRLLLVLPFLGLNLLYLCVRVLALGPAALETHLCSLSLPLAVLNFLNIVPRYLMLLVFPFGLRFLRTTALIRGIADPGCLVALLTLLLIILFLIRMRRRRLLSFALLWFLAGLIPVYCYFNAYPALGGAAMAESWVYLAGAGFCLCLAWMLDRYTEKGRLLAAGFILYFSLITAFNAKNWRDDIVFYERTLKFLPADSMLKRNLAEAYLEAGRTEEAAQLIRELQIYYPDTPLVETAWGNYYYGRGQYAQALEHYNKIAVKSFFSDYKVSCAYRKMNELDKALSFAESSFRRNGFFVPNIINLGEIYSARGETAQAERYYRLALELDFRNKRARRLLKYGE